MGNFRNRLLSTLRNQHRQIRSSFQKKDPLPDPIPNPISNNPIPYFPYPQGHTKVNILNCDATFTRDGPKSGYGGGGGLLKSRKGLVLYFFIAKLGPKGGCGESELSGLDLALQIHHKLGYHSSPLKVRVDSDEVVKSVEKARKAEQERDRVDSDEEDKTAMEEDQNREDEKNESKAKTISSIFSKFKPTYEIERVPRHLNPVSDELAKMAHKINFNDPEFAEALELGKYLGFVDCLVVDWDSMDRRRNAQRNSCWKLIHTLACVEKFETNHLVASLRLMKK